MSDEIDDATYDRLAAIGYVPKRRRSRATVTADSESGHRIEAPGETATITTHMADLPARLTSIGWTLVTLVLVALALLILMVGVASLSQATLGVGMLAVACLAGILARIAQAAGHHSQLRHLIESQRRLSPPTH